jgi:CHAD domain-containing protein
MKRQAMADVVKKYMDQIEKCCDHLPGAFDPEDIHDLRVGYKKIRAFIRLLQFESGGGHLHIPHSLKAIYQSCGHVRDLQLFLPEVTRTPVAPALSSFIKCVNQKLFVYKEQTVAVIEQAHLKKMAHSIKKDLPHHLHDNTVRKFIQRKIASIHILLLTADNETDLHSIRKDIKDIIYNMRIFEHDCDTPFPASGWKSEKELNDMASDLGDFNDRRLAISLLQSDCSNGCNEDEANALHQLQKHWLQQKDAQKQQLLQQVQQLQVEHAF